MKQAIGYTRVSTAGQASEGISLDAQEAKIRDWCKLNNFDLIRICVDAGISGGRTRNRPGLLKAVDLACKLKAPLIVYKLDRFARSTKDCIEISERLNKAGADLVSITERIDTTSAAGKMIFRILAVLAEFERDLISERVTSAMQHLRKQNRRISRHIPYGFSLAPDGKHLVENKHDKRLIARIHKLRDQGMKLREIAEELNRRSIKTKRGHKWNVRIVYHVLKSVG